MKNKIIPIKDIVIDESLYPRVSVSDTTIKDYYKCMEKGNVFPNIDVANYKNQYWLIDGKHRIEANKMKGEKYITCDVRNVGSKTDIYLASIRTNLKHGQRLTNSDKVKIAGRLESLKVDIISISDLLNIKFKSVNRILVKQLKRNHPLTKKFRRQLNFKNVKKEQTLKLDNSEMEEHELVNFLNFLKQNKFSLNSKRLNSILRLITKQIRVMLK